MDKIERDVLWSAEAYTRWRRVGNRDEEQESWQILDDAVTAWRKAKRDAAVIPPTPPAPDAVRRTMMRVVNEWADEVSAGLDTRDGVYLLTSERVNLVDRLVFALTAPATQEEGT